MWIITTRQCISTEVTVKGFKNCCIAKAMDETDYDKLRNSSEEGGNVRSESEEDEDTDYEDGHSNSILSV